MRAVCAVLRGYGRIAAMWRREEVPAVRGRQHATS